MSAVPLLALPPEVLGNIFRNLEINDLQNAIRTCTFLRNAIVNDNSLWRAYSRKKLIILNPNHRQPMSQYWYHQCRLSHNWCNGIYRDKIIIQHRTSYMPWIHYADSQLLIALGSTLRCYTLDKKGFPVKNALWQIEVPQIRRHDIRTNDISRFIVKNDMLVCGNRDGCVAVYKIDKHALKSKPSLLKHIVDCHTGGQSEVSAVEMVAPNSSMSCLVTGSGNSQELRLWQFIPVDLEERLLTCETIFEGVKDVTIPQCVGLRCLAVNSTEDKVAIGPNGNCEPILLDVETGNVLINPQRLLNRKKAVRDIQWHNTNTVCYVTHSGLLEAVDTRSNEMVYSTVDPFRSTLYCVKTDGQRSILVGSSEYSRCVLFDDRKTTQHVQMYFTQKKSSPIYSLGFDSTKLIAAADRSVAVLNFNVSAANVPHRDYSQTFEVVQE